MISHMSEFMSYNPYPLMGESSISSKYVGIDLSLGNEALPKEISYDMLYLYVDTHITLHSADYAIGGYLERRDLYGLSDHFTTGEPRNIHLGVDVWAPAGHPIYAPLDGIVHSFAYNDQHLDYGYTIIVRHELSDGIYHTLYGHLSGEYMDQWQVGQKVSRGAKFASLGDRNENGGWPPHLHFQLIKDMGEWSGDYPGVCRQSELEYYKRNCPDPRGIIFE